MTGGVSDASDGSVEALSRKDEASSGHASREAIGIKLVPVRPRFSLAIRQCQPNKKKGDQSSSSITRQIATNGTSWVIMTTVISL